jgi:hypothetical protein
MTTPYCTGALPARPGHFVLAGPAQHMLLAAATPQTRRCHPCERGAGVSFPLADGGR